MRDQDDNLRPGLVFTEIFDQDRWKGPVKSGPGSSMKATEMVRAGLSEAFEELNIASLCDAPCGDGTWIYNVSHRLNLYLGLDVVPGVVAQAMQNAAPPRHFHAVADISETSLPKVDAVLCRDCLVHMPLGMAMKTLANIKSSGSRWLFTTTFASWAENREARLGSWRPLNLNLAPFDLPAPFKWIHERSPNPNDKYNDKSLGIWDLHAL